MVRRIYIITLFISLLLSINACSAFLDGTLGTNYTDMMTKGNTSRDELHKLFGQPVSSQTYSKPMDSSDIQATSPCTEYYAYSEPKDTPQNYQIIGFEVFTIKGRVLSVHGRPVDLGYVYLDLGTLFLAELITTPLIIIDWINQQTIEKDMTIWYATNDKFVGGEIRYGKIYGSKPPLSHIRLPWWSDNNFITFIPECRPTIRE